MSGRSLLNNLFGFSEKKTKAPTKSGEVLQSGSSRYRVLSTKTGGMGIVYICEALNKKGDVGHKIALKTFPDAYFFDPARSLAFDNEVKLWIRLLGVPFILPALKQVLINNKPYIEMMAVEPDENGDVSLRDRLQRLKRASEIDQTLAVALSVASALHGAAQRQPGIVHGDVKPDNILLVGGLAMLADFGLAHLESDTYPNLGAHGTPAYLAPECWLSASAAPPRDVYAFGCVLFEMLEGVPPFKGDVEALRRSHLGSIPEFASAKPADHPVGALQQIALRCLSKDKDTRPSFEQIIADLVMQGLLFCPHVVMRIAHLRAALNDDKALEPINFIQIRSLLDVGDYKGARELLDSMPHETILGSDLITAGTTASLSGDDQAALVFFDRFLREHPQCDPHDRAQCMNERGLSFKRLDRLLEAEQTFEEALAEAPKESISLLGGNYATTLFVGGKTQQAAEMLSKLVANYPDEHRLWGMLADAEYVLVRPEETIRALRRAVSLAPRDGLYRESLARALMDLKGDFRAALEALKTAYALGVHSHAWAKRTLVCSLLLNNKVIMASLLKAVSESDSEDEARMLFGEAAEEARLYAEGKPPFRTPAEAARQLFGDRSTKPVPPESQAAEELSSVPSTPPVPESCERDIPSTIRNGGGHVQIKVSADNSLALDYYFPTDRSDYVDVFEAHSNEVLGIQRLKGIGEFSLRRRGYYFCRCGGCRLAILTNRDHGEGLRCQQCSFSNLVEPVSEPELLALASRINDRSRPETPLQAGECIIVGFWTADDRQRDIISMELGQRGFLRETAAGFAALCQVQAARAGHRHDGELETWTIASAAGEDSEQTPLNVDDSLRAIRRQGVTTRSISTTVPAELAAAFRMSPSETITLLQQFYRDDPADATRLLNLVRTLAREGQVEEAARAIALSGQLIDAPEEDPQWLTAAGIVARASGRLAEADRRFASATTLNPLDQLPRILRMQTLKEMGDPEGSEQIRAQLLAHGDFSSLI